VISMLKGERNQTIARIVFAWWVIFSQTNYMSHSNSAYEIFILLSSVTAGAALLLLSGVRGELDLDLYNFILLASTFIMISSYVIYTLVLLGLVVLRDISIPGGILDIFHVIVLVGAGIAISGKRFREDGTYWRTIALIGNRSQ
ncbi:unnamed protein product, partial [Acidithrix sp. C25]